MRPLPGGDALPPTRLRSRKSSVVDPSVINSGSVGHGPTTFFMRSEEEMEHSLVASKHNEREDDGRQRENTYGVQSLADTLEAAFGQGSHPGSGKGNSIRGIPTNQERRLSYSSSPASKRETGSFKSSPSRVLKRKKSNHTMSTPLTPVNGESRSPVPPSAIPSTPRSASLPSLKLSDEEPVLDEVASEAIASSGDEDEDAMQDRLGSFPQLVMPSIQMPSRRPFTAKGRAMGKLKVLVAGEVGR
jgi:hypothetical protein